MAQSIGNVKGSFTLLKKLYIVIHYVEIWHVRLGGAKYEPTNLGGGTNEKVPNFVTCHDLEVNFFHALSLMVLQNRYETCTK